MEWIESIRKTIDYVEAHLLEEINSEIISKVVSISPYYLQNGFKILTGYTIAEYTRNRRLYLSALDIISNKEKIIDIAYKYNYDTPESFTKAFTRFHGISPKQLRKSPDKIKIFLPLKVKISIQGGNDMDYIVEKMEGFKLIGFEKEFSYENAHQEIPMFWGEISQKYLMPLMMGKKPESEIEKAICNCGNMGEFGVNIDDIGNGKFRYIIAGTYTGGEVPDGMVSYELPDVELAKFSCKGPMPEALQTLNTKLFNEWLPGNPDYKMGIGVIIEWYTKGDVKSVDYESGLWIAVSKK
ncbi:MAG: effector binding domain-containing protein [Acutalibacteraceae bacterium]|nr:effector binding domain-containing protein [Acutalibacteraceae bacterium]